MYICVLMEKAGKAGKKDGWRVRKARLSLFVLAHDSTEYGALDSIK
jgi:hypothetical protein